MTYELTVPNDPQRDVIRSDGIVFSYNVHDNLYVKHGTFSRRTWYEIINNAYEFGLTFSDYEPPFKAGDVRWSSMFEDEKTLWVFDGEGWTEYGVPIDGSNVFAKKHCSSDDYIRRAGKKPDQH